MGILQFSFALFALLRHAILTLGFVFVDREAVKNLVASFEWALHKSELANFVAVDHDVGKG